MLIRFFRLLSFLDWLSPLLAILQENRNWPVAGFYVPYSAGWSTRAVRHLLQSRGVKVIGMDLAGDLMRFSVPAAQCSFAQYLLSREGIPYTSSGGAGAFDNATSAVPAAGNPTTAWQAPLETQRDRDRSRWGVASHDQRAPRSFDVYAKKWEDKLNDILPG